MEVFMIGEDKDFVFIAFQGVAPNFKTLNNSQKLLIVGFLPDLSWDTFSVKKKLLNAIR